MKCTLLMRQMLCAKVSSRSEARIYLPAVPGPQSVDVQRTLGGKKWYGAGCDITTFPRSDPKTVILHLGSLVLALLLFASLLPADAQPVGKVPRIGYVPSSNEFIRQKVDVIFVGQPFVALAAKQATGDIPIVCGSCGDPTENGLATSLARPGGNVTGLASLSAELIGKRLELMKELLPGVSRWRSSCSRPTRGHEPP